MSILRIIIAIFIPPLAVFLTVGIKGAFWLNLLLTILGYLPGIIHAVWVIAKHDK
ncbi:MAG: YqaE/Pmp3 family membrane protein [Balneola sp.]